MLYVATPSNYLLVPQHPTIQQSQVFDSVILTTLLLNENVSPFGMKLRGLVELAIPLISGFKQHNKLHDHFH